jgi:beta-phosphoglucomutase
MLRMVIFDFDGVIADSEPAHFEMLRRVLKPHQIDLSWDSYCRKYLGYDDNECVQHILEDHAQPAASALIKEIVAEKQRHFADYIRENCLILPGVPELLADLKQNQILCSIHSGAIRTEIETILHQARLRDYFRQIVSTDEVTRSKPDPEGYTLCLNKVNRTLASDNQIQPCQCLAIEDSLWGIQSAKAAGMFCLATETSYPAAQLPLADQVVKDLTGLHTADLQQILNHTQS